MSTRTDVFSDYTFRRMSLFSVDYLLSSIRILIPAVVIVLILLISILAVIAIFVYKKFFLRRKELYDNVTSFFGSRRNRALKDEGKSEQSMSKSKTNTHGDAPGSESDDDVRVEMDKILEAVVSRNKWSFAFDQIMTDTDNNVRNMKVLHSILTIPVDAKLNDDPATNKELEANAVRYAVALRRRRQLGEGFTYLSASRSDHTIGEAFTIAQRLEELPDVQDDNSQCNGDEGSSAGPRTHTQTDYWTASSSHLDVMDASATRGDPKESATATTFQGVPDAPQLALKDWVRRMAMPSISVPSYLQHAKHD